MTFSLFLDICTIVGAIVGVIGVVMNIVLYMVDKAKKK